MRGLEDLVAVEVRDRDLGRRDQVEVVAVTTYIWSSLSGIWPVPRAESLLTTTAARPRSCRSR
jgi:hypothetical protein